MTTLVRKADTERGGENIIQRGSTSGRSHSLCILNAWNEVTGLFDFALLVITLMIGGSWNLNCVQALQPQHSVAWWKAVICYLPWSTNPINTAVKSDHVKTGPLWLLLIPSQIRLYDTHELQSWLTLNGRSFESCSEIENSPTQTQERSVKESEICRGLKARSHQSQ